MGVISATQVVGHTGGHMTHEHGATTTVIPSRNATARSFCGPLGFGPIQDGGLLTPCFVDMILYNIAYSWVIFLGLWRCVRLLQQPSFQNAKYWRNFWGVLFSTIALLCAMASFVLAIVFIEKDGCTLAYVLVRNLVECLAWLVHLVMLLLQARRFQPSTRIELWYTKAVFIVATIQLYGVAQHKYGVLQPQENITFYVLYSAITCLALRSLFYYFFTFGSRIVTTENIIYDPVPTQGEPINITTPRKFYENWSGSVAMDPVKIYAPENEEDIVNIVKAAREAKLTVRVVGRGRANNQSVSTEGILVSLHKMNQIRRIEPTSDDPDRFLCTVECGMDMLDLFTKLLAHEPALCLLSTDDLWDHTVGGSVLAGRHGSGKNWPITAQYVVAMEMVTGTGDILKVTKEDGNLLDAARTSLGYMGIVYSVTLEINTSYKLKQTKLGANVDEVIDNLGEYLGGCEHFEFYWFPHTDKCQTVERKRHDSGRSPGWCRRFINWYNENFVLLVLNRIMERWPATTPCMMQFETKFLDQGKEYEATSIVQSNEDPIQVFYEVEYAFPFRSGLAAFAELRQLVTSAAKWERPYYCNQSVSVRFGCGDQSYLSPVYRASDTTIQAGEGSAGDPEFLFIALYSYDTHVDTKTFFSVLEDIFVTQFEGRPTWAGGASLTAHQRAACFPRFRDFARFCHIHDPDGVFRNQFLKDAINAYSQ